MKFYHSLLLILLIATAGIFLFNRPGLRRVIIVSRVDAAVNITASIPSICGNGVVDSGEQCDGSNLNGQTCITQSFSGGTLSCNSNCTFNTSACANATLPSGGGGGGGGGGGFIPSISQTSVTFRGLAYPKSTITLLKDAQVVAAIPASPDASFQTTISNIAGGIYNFGVWAEDSQGIRSITQNFTVSVASGVTTVVSGIFLPPTASVDKSEVKKGDILNIFGFSAPKAQVSVFVNSDEEIIEKTNTDNSGVWFHKFDTSVLDKGDHSTRARSSLNGDISVYSQLAFFKVGDKNVTAGGQSCRASGNLNGDCKVNLIDFSILAYWYHRPLTDAVKNKVDLNKDGKVDLIDFSIMAYYWTG